jgi:hypothetical protein
MPGAEAALTAKKTRRCKKRERSAERKEAKEN